jgi:hypothetical protein
LDTVVGYVEERLRSSLFRLIIGEVARGILQRELLNCPNLGQDTDLEATHRK